MKLEPERSSEVSVFVETRDEGWKRLYTTTVRTIASVRGTAER